MNGPTTGFKLGVYVCKEAEVVDFASPYGVFSVARRLNPEIDVCLVAETLRPIQTHIRLHRCSRLWVFGSPGDRCAVDPRRTGAASGTAQPAGSTIYP